jgi:hypothetical protein
MCRAGTAKELFDFLKMSLTLFYILEEAIVLFCTE